MNWQKLSKILPPEADKAHLRAQVEGAQVCKLWCEYASQVFMARTMRHHEAINFRDGILTVTVTDSTIVSELKAQQRRIIRQINRALGKTLIHSVRYR
jgi:predicted nucleic acid-binding Zn ribbon protein